MNEKQETKRLLPLASAIHNANWMDVFLSFCMCLVLCVVVFFYFLEEEKIYSAFGLLLRPLFRGTNQQQQKCKPYHQMMTTNGEESMEK